MKEIVIKVKDDIYEKARNEYYGENEVSASMVNEIFSAVFHGISSVNPQKWIPVSERIPEEVGTYITTVDYEKYGLAVGQRYYHGKGLGWEDDCVIAWMPLPKPFEPQERRTGCR